MSIKLALLMVLASVAGFFILRGDSTTDGRRHWVEFDNAFGLVQSADVRVSGAKAGRIGRIRLDMKTKKALVEIVITEPGYTSLRRDAFCETRPQSPIGEYFVDCRPGTDRVELAEGSRIPVRQTASTIPPDLISNIFRRPYRERLRLIINEFGAGLAGRGDDLNEAIRRGVPALRQTSNLLRTVADQNRVIRDLVTDADKLLGRLADNKQGVSRFIVEARDTAQTSATRRREIARNFNRFPRFLRELRPTMVALGQVADNQTPVLRDLSASSGELKRLFDDTAEFSNVARPAVRELGKAALVGREAVRASRPQVAELRRFAKGTPDLAGNLRRVLEDFDDRDRAVEADPRSPGGKGFTGIEAILRYLFVQSQATNAFDQNGHLLRVNTFTDKCGPYGDEKRARDPEYRDCLSWLGPNQPGVNTPDPTADGAPAGSGPEGSGQGQPGSGGSGPSRRRRGADAPSGAGERAQDPATPQDKALIDDLLGNLPGGDAPREVPAPENLLDFLLGP